MTSEPIKLDFNKLIQLLDDLYDLKITTEQESIEIIVIKHKLKAIQQCELQGISPFNAVTLATMKSLDKLHKKLIRRHLLSKIELIEVVSKIGLIEIVRN